SYLVVDGEVFSTRFDDLPPEEASERQVRRFGVGYVETVTKLDDLIVTRRVLAPDAEPRALIAEITIDNLSDQYREIGLVEMWDVNIHQLDPEEAADLSDPDAFREVRRRRRALMESFEHTVSYSADDRVALVETAARDLPGGVASRADVSPVDWFVEPIFLAPIDAAEAPDAVWLTADEGGPEEYGGQGDPSSRTLSLPGAGQTVRLAVRLTIQVPVAAPVTRRFAFGTVPAGRDLAEDLATLRESHGELAAAAADAWRDRLAWFAVPGAEGAGALQREIAWSSYVLQAGAVRDEYTGARVVGPGGAARYARGLEGAPGDLALLAESLLLLDPALARETLLYALSGQSGLGAEVPGQLPHAVGGVGGALHDPAGRRTDGVFLVPAAVARYVAFTRDRALLDQPVPYWPRAAGEEDTVRGHLGALLAYATGELGTGGGGLVAMGASDAGDEPLAAGLAGDGVSSIYSAALIAHGFPQVAGVLRAHDPALADDVQALADEQASLVAEVGWSGQHVHRALDAGGQPLMADMLFLEPQALAILAGIVTGGERDQLLARVAAALDTPDGALGAAPLSGDGAAGAIRPAASAWLTEARALVDPAAGWASLWQNSMASAADRHPERWVGVWTGPRAMAPAGEGGGPDRRVDGALASLPALSAMPHAAALRALAGVLGLGATAAGLRIDPRVPGETFALVAPRLELRGTPTSVGGALVGGAVDRIRMEVTLPSGLRTGDITVRAGGAEVSFSREGDVVSFELPVEQAAAATWAIGR
ncbi:MAG TPA: hypothetical protein VKZ63_08325, partial [Kofleriaceae bacterium]|nr:hypothetical protein [Kofleriaceae bacterium]